MTFLCNFVINISRFILSEFLPDGTLEERHRVAFVFSPPSGPPPSNISSEIPSTQDKKKKKEWKNGKKEIKKKKKNANSKTPVSRPPFVRQKRRVLGNTDVNHQRSIDRDISQECLRTHTDITRYIQLQIESATAI